MTELRATGGDLAYVTVEVVDREGVVVRAARPEISVDVVGAGELIALGSADPVSQELCTGKRCTVFEGRALAIVRSKGDSGEIRVTATADGLDAAEARLSADG